MYVYVVHSNHRIQNDPRGVYSVLFKPRKYIQVQLCESQLHGGLVTEGHLGWKNSMKGHGVENISRRGLCTL